MKKCIAVLLCVWALFALVVPASASDSLAHYWEEYRAYIPAPSIEQYPSEEEYTAAYDAWYSGLQNYIEVQEEARLAAEAARRSEVQEETPPVPIETTPTTTTESAGSKHEISDPLPPASTDTGVPDKYPVGSRVDSAGNVYSPDGELLSPGTTPAMEPDEISPFPSDLLDDTNGASADADTDTLAVIAGLVSDIATDPPVSTIEDLRPANPPVEVLTGLKALVTSIFGEYTPITTTSVVSQTVGNDTYQYLVETVAPGAAGVDYEWVAGVLLFAIMLFCLMKLLGGILK